MSARRILVALLAVGMAVLSFDALRAYALTGKPLTDGVIPGETIMDRAWLAMLWALVVDLSVLTGIWAIKDDRRDWRAWLVLLIALGWTLGFQVFQLDPVVARAVPPIGLALAILVLDLGPARERPERQEREALLPWVQKRLGSWAPNAQPIAQPIAQPTAQRIAQRIAQPSAQHSGLTTAQRKRVSAGLLQGRSALEISKDLGLSNYGYKTALLPLVRDLKTAQLSPNGGPPHEA